MVFSSGSPYLVTSDTNSSRDIFLRDRVTGTTERLSIDSSGSEGNAGSYQRLNPDRTIGAEGRFVAFQSEASNLVPDDTNGSNDVFLRDRLTGTTVRLSVSTDGLQGNLDSQTPSISADGQFVAFQSDASNLVPDDTNENTDIFVHQTGTPTMLRGNVDLQLLAVSPAGQQVVVDIRVPNTTDVVESHIVILDGSGKYSINNPASGTYDVAAKGVNWLREVKPSVNISGAATANFSLINGDSDGTNSVDIIDLNTILIHFGLQTTIGDIDWNSVVNVLDLNAVLSQFGKMGDQ